ncbi:hypothetical protein HDV00_010858, partial [Rhizophlyctis rosea]
MSLLERKELTLAQRETIATLYRHNFTIKQISESEFIPYSTVRNTINRIKKHGSPHPQPRTGRPKKCSERQHRLIARLAKSPEHNKQPSVVVRDILSSHHGLTLNRQTYHNILKTMNVHNYAATHRVYLSKNN